MALTSDTLRAFAALDTRKQVDVLHRVGMETDAADKVLGYLAGNEPERYDALRVALASRGSW